MSRVANERRYRVVFVSAVPDFKGGAETCLKQFLFNPAVEPLLVVPSEGELSAFAREQDIAVEVISYGQVSNVRRPFKIRSVLAAVLDAFKAGIAIRRVAKDWRADCIHSNGLKAHGMLAATAPFNSVPLLCHIHDIPYTSKERWYWKWLQVMSTRLAIVSEHCWIGGKLPDNTVLVPNGIEVDADFSAKESMSKPVSIGFIGRIHPHKGLHLAIDWLSMAHKQGIDFQFYIRGEAAQEQHGYEQDLRALVKKRGLDQVCHFQGRIENYQQLYSGLDITLMPSVVAEPFGLVAIESFERGVVCFAYPSGALPTIIQDAHSGYLCKTPEDFCNKLNSLIEQPALYGRIQKNAQHSLEKNYSLESVYAKLNDIYNSDK